MQIKQLPQYLINKLKAGEVVERPASVVKELIENSIDANATKIVLEIKNGGKSLIKVEDNGIGIDKDQIDLSIKSFATSKISSDNDLNNITSYGFRGEALSTISEVSKFTIQTKSNNDIIATQLHKIDKQVDISQIPFHKDNGTIVIVEDLFFNVPARQKFLKTDTTEYNYILDTFLDFALVNYDKDFVLIKDGKIIKNFSKNQDQYDRMLQIYKKSWENNLNFIENSSKDIQVYGICSDNKLTFTTQNNIKIFVNNRPVDDKIIKKSILQSYQRQIAPGEYPLVLMFIDISSDLVDVNVHPRKKEVKFTDPNSIFNFVQQTLSKTFSDKKVASGTFKKSQNLGFGNLHKNNNFTPKPSYQSTKAESLDFQWEGSVYSKPNIIENQENNIGDMKVIGQIWDSYIIVQLENELYLVDQHAVAERITFEKMKNDMQENKLNPEIIMHPISIDIPQNLDIHPQIEKLNNIGFDVSLLDDYTIVVYAIPKILSEYSIDIQKLFDKLLYMDDINMDSIFENIFATKACKTSIKAGEKLSMSQMVNLIKDAYKYIDKMFVCQHGRPSIVKLSKEDIEKLFDRN
ncbi:DNA mismatch repair endonuclease MutL [Candidatus Absconditicoccus praedator]|uniref:DNA mismatch repair endonuclease MutL n=1 Tax=Candidatus Absconditicoccus praedator TaxID=2735562 RepID=UPI001E301F36|nr:DNA mismatch repair endonuclease MutL [Candidatus Absconditicoccus praedator]UFX82588.1 DNA mismatch repair endonuclease MutL [Candidatus Absconditicoccus praedator]